MPSTSNSAEALAWLREQAKRSPVTFHVATCCAELWHYADANIVAAADEDRASWVATVSRNHRALAGSWCEWARRYAQLVDLANVLCYEEVLQLVTLRSSLELLRAVAPTSEVAAIDRRDTRLLQVLRRNADHHASCCRPGGLKGPLWRLQAFWWERPLGGVSAREASHVCEDADRTCSRESGAHWTPASPTQMGVNQDPEPPRRDER